MFDTSLFYIQTAGQAWSYSLTGGTTRFELRSGDHWSGDSGTDRERAEIAEVNTFVPGQGYHIEFDVMIEPGAANTAGWLTLAQIQSTLDPGEDGHSPPFAIELVGERMRIVTRASSAALSTTADTTYVSQYTDGADIVRGHTYHFSIDEKFDPFGQGYLKVWRDDAMLVNYKGALGFNDLTGGYWKEGVYRAASPETLAADYSGLSISPEASLFASALINPLSLLGTAGADILTGDTLNDTLLGMAGADFLSGGGGDDLLRGGDGRDTLDGGAGADTADYSDKTAGVSIGLTPTGDTVVVVGGLAEDTLRNVEHLSGGGGADTLTGNALANSILGGDGDDRLKGGPGADTLDGGAGSDTVDYTDKTTAVAVTLNGANDVVVQVGGAAEDVLRNVENITATAANDTLIGDARDNLFIGGAGDDLLIGGAGRDVMDGANGVDTADYQDKSRSMAVTLNNNLDATVYVGGVAEDVLRNVENVNGGAAGDTLTGDSKDNTFLGFGGSDYLRGGVGNDDLRGNAANDTLDGGLGQDTLIGGAGADVLTGGADNDLFRFQALSESTPAAPDRITDYAAGDVIDLSLLDANSLAAGNQAFTVVTAFTRAAGQLMLSYAGGVTTVLADVDGDGAADFALQLTGQVTTTSGWLL